MSLKLARKVFINTNGVQQAILRQLALYGADHFDGRSIIYIYPSQETIAEESGFSLATVKRAYKFWIERKVLVFVKNKKLGVKEYFIDLIELNKYLKKSDENGSSERAICEDQVAQRDLQVAQSDTQGSSQRATINYYNLRTGRKSVKAEKVGEELTMISSPSHLPIDRVRENGLIDPHLVRTVHQRQTGLVNIAEIMKMIPAGC